MTPAQLNIAIQAALTVAFPQLDQPLVRVERPRNRDHGDWSTNVALQLAKSLKQAPREVAQQLVTLLQQIPGVAQVDVAGPGFLNLTLDLAAAGELARTIVQAGAHYGNNESLAGQVVNLEFVSANPTGPLHIGHTRWAALGDALGRLLRASGAQVFTEHYVNDAGAQMDRFGGSILARLTGAEIPEGGYPGEYVAELGKQVLIQHPDLLSLPQSEAVAVAREAGYRLQLAEMRETLLDFGVEFDEWFSEASLYESGAVLAAVERLRAQGHVFEAEGAVWLRTTDFMDDRDRVLIRSDGVPTYFASDAAYYLNKKDRGFPVKFYMLGADHHGYVNRLKAIVACAGDDPEVNITVLIGQMVNLDGARLSKRAGNIVELRDLLDWIGADAVRYSLARYPADSPLNLDGEQLRKKTNDNPVFYVQYAHARTCNVAKLAAADGIHRADGFDPALLSAETESVLLGVLGEFPGVVAQAAQLHEPHRIARYLEVLAGAYHRWYDACRVRPMSGDEPITDLHRTRLWLNDASRIVVARGLDLLGVSAPEQL